MVSMFSNKLLVIRCFCSSRVRAGVLWSMIGFLWPRALSAAQLVLLYCGMFHMMIEGNACYNWYIPCQTLFPYRMYFFVFEHSPTKYFDIVFTAYLHICVVLCGILAFPAFDIFLSFRFIVMNNLIISAITNRLYKN